jgi:hypothetical protein
MNWLTKLFQFLSVRYHFNAKEAANIRFWKHGGQPLPTRFDKFDVIVLFYIIVKPAKNP